MKKFRITAIILLCAAMLSVFAGCGGSKTAITADDFKNAMEEKDYIVIDASEQFAAYDYVKQVYIAADEGMNYQIEFYQLSDIEMANAFFENNKSIFEQRKTNVSTESSVSFPAYGKYTLSTGGDYMLLSRIGDTVIYVDVSSAYKDNIKEVLDSLGY